MMNDAEEESRVGEFLRNEVDWWDDQDNVKGVAMFKGFSGQRSDWEGRYLFWRDLILKVARHLHTFIIRPSRLSNIWFRRDPSLSPLCLPQVLLEMYNAGDLIRTADLADPKSGRLSVVLWKAVRVLGFSRQSFQDSLPEDVYILSVLLKEKASEVVKLLSDTHWTSSCVITMSKFQQLCGGLNEASALLSYLSSCGKAKYLAINKKDLIEGVKISLTAVAISDITSLDCDLLHLIRTAEKLEEQVDMLDQRCQKSKSSASASLKSGNRKIALRHARELRLTSQSMDRCTMLLNRIMEVIHAITDAESSKKVSEAIKVGAQAMKENRINVEDIEQCLLELDLSVNSLKEVDELLGSTLESAKIEDEDVEDELKLLELEMNVESVKASGSKTAGDCEVGVAKTDTADSLCNGLSNMSLNASPGTKKELRKSINQVSNDVNLECA